MSLANAARTAMTRTDVSRPVQVALVDGILRSERTFFDFGCGRGGDVERLSGAGFVAAGWDPAHAPDEFIQPADVVNLGYVVNVIEDRHERADTLRRAWDLARSVLVVAARPDWEAGQVRGQPRGDGIVTSKGTFQKFYGQDELRTWIEAVLGHDPIAAAPGIFYVFRDQAEAAGVRVRRFRTRASSTPRPRRADALWEQHRELLEPLAEFWETRGRLPDPKEIEKAAEIAQAIGSIRSAGGILRRVLGDERFEIARADTSGQGGTVTFGKSGRTLTVDGATTLLQAGEQIGVAMQFGCRMGICQTCVVPLTDGHVRDIRSGEEHRTGDRVQTCISVAAGDCTLDL